ncbi:MAG: hypothetical protein J5817_06835 [Treponema sp.]|nr:hypothetical protein [Treponema sp.]
MSSKKLLALRIFLLLLSLAFVAAGIFRRETFRIFIKASNVCLECIGIG